MSEVINERLSYYVDASVLCWLATVSDQGQPNVAPKEVFCLYEHDLLIANIASPNSVRNIAKNPKVCISLIDIFEEKGCKVYGEAHLVMKDNHRFSELENRWLRSRKGTMR